MELTVAGARVHATTGGRSLDPARPLLVFVHGAGMDHSVWSLQTRYFAAHGWSVLAVDLPGHAGSEGPAPPSIEDYAVWLDELIPTTGFTAAALVGHSMGALVALQLAATAPHLVTDLALLGVAATMPVHPDLLAAARAGDRLASELVIGWSFSPRARLGGHPTPGTWMTGSGLRLMDHVASGVLGTDLDACNNYTGAVDAATQVTCPTLLLLGEQDLMTRPAAAQPLENVLGNSHTVVLPGAGHMMMIEQPDAVIDTLAEFFGAGAP